MAFLNWVGEHPFLTVVLLLCVVPSIHITKGDR
jgi:hypothetical protein